MLPKTGILAGGVTRLTHSVVMYSFTDAVKNAVRDWHSSWKARAYHLESHSRHSLAEPGAYLGEEVIRPQHPQLVSSNVSGATGLAMRLSASDGQRLGDTPSQKLCLCFRLRIQCSQTYCLPQQSYEVSEEDISKLFWQSLDQLLKMFCNL